MDILEHFGVADDPDIKLRRSLLEDSVQLINALVKARHDKGLSIREVAARMGSDASAVHKFESGERDPHLSTIRRYARAVGVRIETKVHPVIEYSTEITAVGQIGKPVWSYKPIDSEHHGREKG